MSIKFCLSYDFIAFKMNIVSIRKCIVDMVIVSDVTCMHQSVITRGHTMFMIRRYPLYNSNDKNRQSFVSTVV